MISREKAFEMKNECLSHVTHCDRCKFFGLCSESGFDSYMAGIGISYIPAKWEGREIMNNFMPMPTAKEQENGYWGDTKIVIGTTPGITHGIEQGEQMKPKKIIFSGRATIIIWEDETKTIVKKSDNDNYDREKAVLMAYFQKSIGLTKSQASKRLKGWCK